MIPPEKSEAVVRALREAFGTAEFDGISRMMGGLTSSLVYCVVVGGAPYLLKVMMRAEDPTRHYENMTTAAEAGVAPRVRYTNAGDKIAITDFVRTVPLPAPEALVRLPALLHELHSLPAFGRAPFNTTCTFLLHESPMLQGFLQRFQAADLLSAAERQEFLSRYAELKSAYPQDETDLVSSHNDLFKPDNILFDGRRVWLADWEAAFLNDRYADLAVVANQIVTNEEEEIAYLQEYFGQAPDEYQLARFHVMQQIAHLFYAMAFLSLGAAGKPVAGRETVPEFPEYQRRLWAGQIDLASNDAKALFGRVHGERLLHNVRQARYREALRIVSGRQPAR